MAKLLSLTIPFAAFGRKLTATHKPARTIGMTFTPGAARSVALSARTRGSVVHPAVSSKQEWLFYFLIALNVLLFGSYVVSVNSSAASGYEISSLQRSIHTLTEEGKKLTLQNAEIKSMITLHEGLQAEGYVPVLGAEYIQAPNHLTQR